MALNHGINTYKSNTNFVSIKRNSSGVPFFIGCWPCHTAGGFTGKPQLVNNFEEARTIGGYSDEWRDGRGVPKWSLCQAAYSHFVLFAMSPAVFYNVFDPSVHFSAQQDVFVVEDHCAKLPIGTINDDSLVVKASEDLVAGTDYEAYYSDENLVIELLGTGRAYGANQIEVGYHVAQPSMIEPRDIIEAIEKIEACKGELGIVPDLLCVPGWTALVPEVAHVLAAKAANVNGLFRCKAVVDLKYTARSYENVLEVKNLEHYTDDNMIVCWPLVKVGDKVFDVSVIFCGQTARVDSNRGNIPSENVSNKHCAITGMVLIDGTEVTLTSQQADVVSKAAGVVTCFNYDGWRLWGNYTGAYPETDDPSRAFICCNRMHDFICNAFVNMFWDYLDRPLSRVLIDTIVNRFNGYLAGLTQNGHLYGGEIAYVPDNNSANELIAGHFRLDAKMASPVPAQRIDMIVEFNIQIMLNAINI